jgi:hypothetical protein
VLFKTLAIGTQWTVIHPELRSAIGQLGTALEDWGLPPLTVTEALRNAREQEEIYWRTYAAKRLDEAAAREKARHQFSWHLLGCAADFRGSKPWAPEEERRIRTWLGERCEKPKWEVLFHDVGQGLHFHVAVRDYGWRRRWAMTRDRA